MSRGRHRVKLTRRGRRLVAALVLVLAMGSAVSLASREDPSAVVERACGRPGNLRSHRGITLRREAMRAFRRAERIAGKRIEVVQSFRSCREQALACQRICGNRKGCPGTCAPPGLSWHQRGMAIDVDEAALQTDGVVAALEGSGWCQPLPEATRVTSLSGDATDGLACRRERWMGAGGKDVPRICQPCPEKDKAGGEGFEPPGGLAAPAFFKTDCPGLDACGSRVASERTRRNRERSVGTRRHGETHH